MSIPHIFANYPAGRFPAGDWDANWQFVGLTGNIFCTAGGTGNAIVLTPANTSIAVTAYQSGSKFTFFATNNNSGAVTISVSPLATVSLLTATGGALATGAIAAGGYYEATFDGTNFRLGATATGGGGTNLQGVINIKDFGAVGDGVHDDTSAINACYATLKGGAGTVVWPPGAYKISSSILIGDTTSGAGAPQSSINTIGLSSPAFGVEVRYTGASNAPAFVIGRNPYTIFRSIYVHNTSGTRGTTTGLLIGGSGPGASGTQTYSALFDNVYITDFHVGIQDGNFGTMSECTFLACAISNCDTGYTQNDFNCLDNMFINAAVSGCGVGFDNGAAENIGIYGGSSSSNTTDFNVEQNASVYNIYNWRSENSGLNVNGVGSGGNVAIKGCLFKDVTGGINVGTSVNGAFSTISIEDTRLHGWIILNPPGEKIRIINCFCQIDPNTNFPFIVPTSGPSAKSSHVILKSNTDAFNSPLLPTPDFDGAIKGASPSLAPFGGAQSFTPNILKIPYEFIAVNSGTPYGMDILALSQVRQLAEGPTPGAVVGTTAVITLTTNAATTSGSNVLHFASTAGAIVGMVITDTSNSVIPGGSFVTAITTNSSITINNTVTGGGVLNGDTIKLQASAPLITQGNNLRVQGQFASSGTLPFTFVRSQPISANNSATITATSGKFFPADVGKFLTIPGVPMAPSWTNWYGSIVGYTDSTHVIVASGGQFVPGTISTTASIGVNEPDGNFMVLVTGDNNETFWVTAITSTGFTVHSSNSTSTANITALIVR